MKKLLSTFLAPDSRAAKIITSVLLLLPVLVELLQTLTTAQLLDPDTNRALLAVAAGLKIVSNFTSKKPKPPVREKRTTPPPAGRRFPKQPEQLP